MSSIAPPHSYINVQDFTSTKHLVEYLEEVNKNDTLFASYFWWKEYYYQTEPGKESWCELCKVLHDEKNLHHQKPPDILKIQDMSRNCKSPPFIELWFLKNFKEPITDLSFDIKSRFYWPTQIILELCSWKTTSHK